MKTAIIVGLLCLNAALLAALVFGAGTPVATAQVIGGASDYLVLTGRVQGNEDALYVFDLATRRCKIWKFDANRKRLAPIGILDLKRDFGRPANPTP